MSTGCFRVLWQREGCIEKKSVELRCVGNKVEKIKRITKGSSTFLLSLSLFLVSSLLSCPPTWRSFSNKVRAYSFKSLTKVSNKSFSNATGISPGNLALSIYTTLSKSLYLILLVMFQPNSNFTLFVNLSYRLNPSLLMWISDLSVCQRVNVAISVFCHLHVPFLAKPLFTTLTLFILWQFILLSLSIQRITFVECFHLCIVPQVSIDNFLIGNARMLQAFLCHH